MLIFDFDGVLFNTLDEVSLTAYNAVTGKLFISLEELPGDLVGLFRRNRFHFQSAGDALPLMSWCIKNFRHRSHALLSQEEYGDIIDNAGISLPRRTEIFFAARKRFVERNEERWRALNIPYQPLWDELIHRGGSRVVILTNKNRKAVLDLCRSHDLEVLEENIYSGDGGVKKIENLNQIRRRSNGFQYCIIDDSLKNLREIDCHFQREKEKLILLFAAWGYIGPEDESKAKALGYPSFSQRDLIDILDAELI